MSSPYAEEKQRKNCARDMRNMEAMKECGRQNEANWRESGGRLDFVAATRIGPSCG